MKYFVRYKTNVEVNADVGENMYQERSKIFMNIEREIAVLIWELLSTSVVEFFFFFDMIQIECMFMYLNGIPTFRPS